MLALLVAGLCVGNYECGAASTAYYKSRPELRQYVKHYQAQLNNEVLVGIGVAYGAAVKQQARLRLGRGLSLSLGADSGMIIFKGSF
jgi:hypothetical protein